MSTHELGPGRRFKSQLGEWYEREQVAAEVARAVEAERERNLIALREWAVARWRDEVQCRPLVNVHRRSLDDTWRQVMRYAGLDPDEAVGPSHDALVAASNREGAR